MATKKINGTEFQYSKTDNIFALVKLNDKIRIACGREIVSSNEFDTFEDAEKYIKRKPYELIINTAVVALKFAKEQEDTKQNEKTID